MGIRLPDGDGVAVSHDDIDLREYAFVLWKRRGLVTAATLGAMLVSAVLSFFVLSPVYEATVYLRTVQGDLKDFAPAQIINTQYFAAAVLRFMGDVGGYSPREVMSMISVREIPNSRMTEIKVEHTDPGFASRMANAVATVFEDELERATQEAVKKASGGAEEAIAQAREELSQAYERKNSLNAQIDALDLDLNRLRGVVSSYKTALADARLRAAELKEGLGELEETLARTPRMLSGPPDWQGKPTEVPNATYQTLEQQIATRRAELAQLVARVEELNKVLPGIEEEMNARARELSRLLTERDQLEQRISSLEDVVRNLSQKLAQYQASAPVVSLASPAMVPDRPVRPRRLLNVSVAGVLGFFASVMWVLVSESWSRP